MRFKRRGGKKDFDNVFQRKKYRKYGNRVYNVLRTILIMKFETRQKMARVFRQSGRRFLRGAMKRQKKKRDCIV